MSAESLDGHAVLADELARPGVPRLGQRLERTAGCQPEASVLPVTWHRRTPLRSHRPPVRFHLGVARQWVGHLRLLRPGEASGARRGASRLRSRVIHAHDRMLVIFTAPPAATPAAAAFARSDDLPRALVDEVGCRRPSARKRVAVSHRGGDVPSVGSVHQVCQRTCRRRRQGVTTRAHASRHTSPGAVPGCQGPDRS